MASQQKANLLIGAASFKAECDQGLRIEMGLLVAEKHLLALRPA